MDLPHTWGLKELQLKLNPLLLYLPHTWGLKVCHNKSFNVSLNLPHTWGLKEQLQEQNL